MVSVGVERLREFATTQATVALNVRVAKTLKAFQMIARALAGYHGRKNLVWVSASFPDRKSTRLNSSHDQISYAVFCLKITSSACDGEARAVAVVLFRPPLRVLDGLDDLCGQQLAVPENIDPDPVAVHALVVSDLSEVLREEVHEVLDFLARSPKILRGECVDGEDSDADLQAPLEDLLEFVSAFHVTVEDVAQANLPGEPAVPVHDDGDVMRDRGLADLVEEPTFIRLIRGVADDL